MQVLNKDVEQDIVSVEGDVDKDGVPSGNFCTILLILWLALTSTGQGSPFPSEVV